ncbi:MAG TPA: condensation domain-containing protein, partial [Edaphobacter sp.]|nr:condensation domain-containing protein [Edaphobacter sp.]
RLIVVPYWVTRSPEEFCELLANERVTILNQTPSAFRQIMKAEGERGDKRLRDLRAVIFAGEALDVQNLCSWWKRYDEHMTYMVNMYGITEITVHASYRLMSMADVKSGPGSAIGVPIPDLQIYVLDEWAQLVPVGVVGELYVGGPGVALGYWQRPDLTAQRFIPDAYSGQAGSRLYKSGDLARQLPNGELEYLGRADHQVKIRGFRVELGEVESALMAHPAAKDAAVLAYSDESGVRRLMGYLVLKKTEAEKLDQISLKEFLRDSIPEYMIPDTFIQLETMPLTPNGKLDRKALQVVKGVEWTREQPYSAPSTTAEKALAQVWEEVLHVQRVGVDDNLFNLGGDSIRSIQLRARSLQVGVDFTLRDLFQYQTIRRLAAHLGSNTENDEVAYIEPFTLVPESDRDTLPADLEDAYPLASLQLGMLFHMEFAPREAVYHNVNSYLLRAPWDSEKFSQALQSVVIRHPILRTSFDLHNYSEPLQLVHRDVRSVVGQDDIRGLDGAAQEKVVAEFLETEKRSPFDISVAPQFRIHVHRRSRDSFQLTLTENHAILDGWSLHASLAEIFEYYFFLIAGKTLLVSPPLHTTYRDFVYLERLAVEAEENQTFWRKEIEGCTVNEIRPWRAPEPTDEGDRIQIVGPSISSQLSAGLKNVSKSLEFPLKSVLLAAHLMVVSRLTATEDVITGVTLHGRPVTPDGEQVRGLFLNTVPFRHQIREVSWHRLIQQVFELEQAMLPHRRFPFSAIQREHGLQPLFDSMFNFVHFHVLDSLIQSRDIEVLRFQKYEATNYTLVAAFSTSSLTSQIGLELEYDTTRLPRDQVEAWGSYYLRTLESLVADPSARAFCPLIEAECSRILYEWNFSTSSIHKEVNVTELFAKQAHSTPSALAVACGDIRLSYAELERRSNQLANFLKKCGVCPEVLVGVCVDRTADMLASILGILKAGG